MTAGRLLCYIFIFLLSAELCPAADSPTAMGLKNCLSEVMAKNPGLAQARFKVRARDMAVKSAIHDLLPSMSMKYGYTRDPDALPLTGLKDSYDYTLAIEQPLYKGKFLITALQQENLNLDLARRNLQKTEGDLIVQVHKAYYEVLKRKKLAEEAGQAVIRLQSHLKNAKGFFLAGLIPKNDLLTSEVEMAQGEQDRLQAENNLALARANLNIMMKRPADNALEVKEVKTVSERWTLTWAETLARAEKLRPEIEQSEINLVRAEKNVIMARAPYLPSLSLSAAYKKQGDGPDLKEYPLGASEEKTVQATFQWRFWAWGQSLSKVAEARHQVLQAGKGKEIVADAITLEVRKAYLDLQQAKKNIAVTRKAVEQAEENYRLSESRYQARLATSTEVLDAQALLTRARTNHYNALYDYNITRIGMDWATGSLADRNKSTKQ